MARLLAVVLSVATFAGAFSVSFAQETEGSDHDPGAQESVTITGTAEAPGDSIEGLDPTDIELVDADAVAAMDIVEMLSAAQTIYLKGSGNEFTDKWLNVFYLGGSEEHGNPQVWHLVYTGNDPAAISSMQLTFNKDGDEEWSYVFNWTQEDGFSTNQGGNNPGWVIIAPYDWELDYIDKGNSNESGCFLITSEDGNINFNVSGYHKGTPPPPPPELYGGFSVIKYVDGIHINMWIEESEYTIGQLIRGFNLYRVSGPGAGIAGLTPIAFTTIDDAGGIGFTNIPDGWYAIEEVLTAEGESVFEPSGIMYVQLADKQLVGGDGPKFDREALYTIVNGYGNGYTLGYPGLNNTGDIFPIAVANSDTGEVYPSLCAEAGARNFAGESGLGCSGYLVASMAELTNSDGFIKAFNYIEDNYGHITDYRPITQIVAWYLLGAIEIPSAEFDNINWSVVESGLGAVPGVPGAKAIVLDVVAGYSNYTGSGNIVDIVYMLCEHHHDPHDCQPQLVPIYSDGGFDNRTKYNAKGELTLTGTKIIEGIDEDDIDLDGVDPDEGLFTFTVRDVTGRNLSLMTEEEIRALPEVSSGKWMPNEHITFTPITYKLENLAGDGPWDFVYWVKENQPLPAGWSTASGHYLIYVRVTDDGEGTLIAKAYKDADYTEEFGTAGVGGSMAIELEKYLEFDNEYNPVVELKALKLTEGAGELTDWAFSFALFDVEAFDEATGTATGISQTARDEQVATKAAPEVAFEKIVYYNAGKYYYLIKEIGPAAGDTDWNMSVIQYLVEVAVEEDADNDDLLSVTGIRYKTREGDDGEWSAGWTAYDDTEINVVFVNEYVLIKSLSVEVDKDTIKRTSAAYDGSTAGVQTSGQDIYNVGDKFERYRYDINFRSTSNTDADEFVVDDPLESVSQGYVRLTGLWTPAVWGDKDGRYNIWYKTKNGSGNDADVIGGPVTVIPDGSVPLFQTNRLRDGYADGWKLWTTVVQTGAPDDWDGVIGRVALSVDGLNLAAGDYVTALRFEFGAVYKGFTSRNYNAGKAMNEGLDGEDNGVRNTNGVDDFYKNGTITTLSSPVPAPAPLKRVAAFFTGDVSALEGPTQSTPEPDAALIGKGKTNDWTPVPGTSFYNEAINNANTPLAGATYLVDATSPQYKEIQIVSSAAAFIGLGGNAPGGLFDKDQDAVLTRVIVSFTTEPEGFDFHSIEIDSFFENADEAGLQLIDGVWYDGNRRIGTGDAFALNMWFILIAASLACTGLLIWFIATPAKKGRRNDPVSATVKGGGRK